MTRRLPAIDVLRGVAVLMVLVSHLPFTGATAPALGERVVFSLTDFGAAGVHLFLVISGFCIHLPHVRSEGTRFLPFWRRRLHRLYPPYFVAVVLTIVGLVLTRRAGIASQTTTTGLAVDVISLLLLLQNFTNASIHVGNAPLWTLALEEQLYALYFGLLGLRRTRSWRATLLVVGAVTMAFRLFGFLDLLPVTWAWLGPTRWIEWVLGALAVEAYFQRATLPGWSRRWPVAGVAFLLGVVLREPGQLATACPELAGRIPLLAASRALDWFLGDLLFALAGFVAINAAIAAEIDAPVLRRVGLFSYSLYLVHVPALGLAKIVGLRLHFPITAIYLLRACSGIAAGWAFHRLVERRFLRARAT